MLSGQSPFLDALGWAVVNSFWQMALLWICCQGLGRLPFYQSPSRRASLATTGLFTGFSWFLFTFFSAWIQSGDDGLQISSSYGTALRDPLRTILPYASFIYLILLFLPLYRFIGNIRFVRTIRTQGLQKISVDWRLFTRNTAERMGIRKPVQIWLSNLVTSPVTVGYLKPVILIPVAAISQLTPHMIEAIILHELSHIRRYDYLMNLLTRFIRMVLYFNPFVSLFQRVIEREREKDCDDMVLQFRYDATGYATALLLLEQYGRKPAPLLVPATGHGHELLHRIERILGVSAKAPVLGSRRIAGLLTGLIILLGMNFILRLQTHETGTKGLSRFAHTSTFNSLHNGYQFASMPETFAAERPDVTADLKQCKPSPEDRMASADRAALPGLMHVNLLETVKPVLAKAQELQVASAINESRRVLENLQWKVTEKKLAEVFTEQEKAALKKKYLEKVSKFDWNKWEDKLKLAYNEVDWNRINSQLDAAMNHIRIDSLQSVYNMAASRLDEVSRYMKSTEVKGIPDTDISLKEVEKQKKQVEQMLRELKIARNKKIVHL